MKIKLFAVTYNNNRILNDLSNTIFQYKWGQKANTTNWQASFTNDLSLKGDNFIYYPYFEKDIPIEKLKQQNFIIQQ